MSCAHGPFDRRTGDGKPADDKLFGGGDGLELAGTADAIHIAASVEAEEVQRADARAQHGDGTSQLQVVHWAAASAIRFAPPSQLSTELEFGLEPHYNVLHNQRHCQNAHHEKEREPDPAGEG